jgi:hypothetical protein
MEAAVEAANFVVQARIVGMIDTKPAARHRKHREAHWVDIERTLKGNDETSTRFRVRPNGQHWQDGRSYILFLDWVVGDWAEAVPQPLLAATAANLDQVAAVVADRGEGVATRRVFWMKHQGGWQPKPWADWIVGADGAFEWRHCVADCQSPKPRYATRTGRVAQAAIDDLIGRIETAPARPIADDIDTVSFRWLDPSGAPHLAVFPLETNSPAQGLIDAIEALIGVKR